MLTSVQTLSPPTFLNLTANTFYFLGYQRILRSYCREKKGGSRSPALHFQGFPLPLCLNPSLHLLPSSQETPKTLFPLDFPPRHPKCQSHLPPLFKKRPPFLEPPPGSQSHRPERAACLFSRESGTRQAHALQQQTRLNGEFARSGRGQLEGVGGEREGAEEVGEEEG